nr:zinc finger, CCHC-type, retrotransposon Gag domain protein [Tanacetum cinerariifolium]
MVNTRTDADLSAAVQNALQTLLPQIRAEIREEFRTSSGPSDSGENSPPVTIHTWIERFNKQKPPAGTEEEQAKNFQWGLRMSTLNHLMCIKFMDVAQTCEAMLTTTTAATTTTLATTTG